jgi:hypothetical protein
MKKQCISSLSSINYKTDVAKVWRVVRELTGKPQSSAAVPGITADILNRHYAAISTDSDYHNPAPKLTAAANTDDVITEWQVFKVLDRLRPTATGLDRLPAWYLRLAAPVFAKPLARLFSSSLSTSTVPSQWKQAWIQPVSKVVAPTQPSDYRPISITPILTRVMERMVVTQYIYPSLLAPPAALISQISSHSDQLVQLRLPSLLF